MISSQTPWPLDQRGGHSINIHGIILEGCNQYCIMSLRVGTYILTDLGCQDSKRSWYWYWPQFGFKQNKNLCAEVKETKNSTRWWYKHDNAWCFKHNEFRAGTLTILHNFVNIQYNTWLAIKLKTQVQILWHLLFQFWMQVGMML